MHEFLYLIPEALLTLTLAGVISAEISYHGERVRLVSGIVILGLLGTLIQLLFTMSVGTAKIFSNSLTLDGLSFFFKGFCLLLGLLVTVMATFSREIQENTKTEYYAFLVAAILSLFIVAAASDLILIFVALQLLSVLTYFLTGQSKRDIASTKSGIKFMVMAILSASLFLYAACLLFSFTHSLNLYEMHAALSNRAIPHNAGLLIFFLLFLSLSFYWGAFPMYVWMPDVFAGAPTPTGAFLALGVSSAGFAVALRLFLLVFSGPSLPSVSWATLGEIEWPAILAFISGATMLAGGLLAIRQQTVKRLVACLLITHFGFLMTSFVILNAEAISALLFNLVVDLVCLAGVFAAFSCLIDYLRTDRFTDFRGLLANAIPESICLMIFLGAFVGLPPFPGFVGKFILIGTIVEQHWYVLALLAVVTSVLALFAFGRFCFQLVDQFSPNNKSPVTAFPQRMFLYALLLPLFLLSFFADQLIALADGSFRFFLW